MSLKRKPFQVQVTHNSFSLHQQKAHPKHPRGILIINGFRLIHHHGLGGMVCNDGHLQSKARPVVHGHVLVEGKAQLRVVGSVHQPRQVDVTTIIGIDFKLQNQTVCGSILQSTNHEIIIYIYIKIYKCKEIP